MRVSYQVWGRPSHLRKGLVRSRECDSPAPQTDPSRLGTSATKGALHPTDFWRGTLHAALKTLAHCVVTDFEAVCPAMAAHLEPVSLLQCACVLRAATVTAQLLQRSALAARSHEHARAGRAGAGRTSA